MKNSAFVVLVIIALLAAVFWPQAVQILEGFFDILQLVFRSL